MTGECVCVCVCVGGVLVLCSPPLPPVNFSAVGVGVSTIHGVESLARSGTASAAGSRHGYQDRFVVLRFRFSLERYVRVR